MPLGNGDIALNAWVESTGDLLFYIGKSDSWEDNSRLAKVGLVRVKLTPTLLPSGATFEQRLDPLRGEMIVTVKPSSGSHTVARVWVDANKPVIHVAVNSPSAVTASASFEPWRTAQTTIASEASDINYGNPAGTTQVVEPDTVLTGITDGVGWYHRNSRSLGPNETMTFQDLQGAPTFSDKILGRTFGALIRSGTSGIRTNDQTLTTPSGTSQRFDIYVLTKQPATEAEWLAAIRASYASIESTAFSTRYTAHLNWWQTFWNRSYIAITPGVGATDLSAPTELATGYSLQRFVTACAGRGSYPIKFNGSLFTVPWSGKPGDADYRQWGQGYWWQNTRLPYAALCTSGDFDMLPSLHRMYLEDVLPVARYRAGYYYTDPKFDDACYMTEVTYPWGAVFSTSYGWTTPAAQRSAGDGKLQSGGWHKREWVGGLELMFMMLDYYDHTGDEPFLTGQLIPAAMPIVRWFDRYYTTGTDGKLVMNPSQALETWWTCTNPMPEVAGLQAVVGRLLALPANLLSASDRTYLTTFQAKIPDLPTRVVSGTTMLAPAQSYSSKNNSELPELYAVYPFRLASFEKANAEQAIAAYSAAASGDKGNVGWRQDDIFLAYLGLANQARTNLVSRVRQNNTTYDCRFPAFWGPNFDWIPDQCHGGVLMKATQAMLLQSEGDKIFLLPAWPSDWNVDFKLRAPKQTTVEGTVQNGVLTALKVTPASRRANIVLPVGYTDPEVPQVYPVLPLAWGAATTISGETDVLTAGVLRYAYALSNTTATVNSVPFAAGNSTTALGTDVTLGAWDSKVSSAYAGTAAPYTALTASYQNLLKGGVFTNAATTATVTLNNLVAGHSYLTQLWVNDSRTTGIPRNAVYASGTSAVTLEYNVTNISGGVGQHVAGLFVADEMTEALTITGNASSQFNAIQVRDVTNVGFWTGAAGTTWDAATTANFASNAYNAPLALATSATASLPLNSLTFADAYWDNDLATAVSGSSVNIATGGVSTGTVYFHNWMVPCTVASSDANGIKDATTVRVAGGGLVTLAGRHAYTGPTLVVSGTLILSGTLAGSEVTVKSGARFQNNGLVSGNVVVEPGGTLAPPGTIGGNLINSGTVVLTGSDVLQVGGTFTNNGTVDVRTWSGTLPQGMINNGTILGTPPSVQIFSPTASSITLASAATGLRMRATVTDPGYFGTPVMAWTKIPELSGTGTVTFGNAASLQTTATFSDEGLYVLRCDATTGAGTGSAQVVVSVNTPFTMSFRDGVNGYSHPATFIRGDTATWNSGLRDQMLVGRNNGGGMRTLLSFDVSEVPADATVTGAQLDLWTAASGVGTSIGPLSLCKLLADFTEGTGNGTVATSGTGTGADWKYRTNGTANPWAAPGGVAGMDFEGAPLSTLLAFDPSTTGTGTQQSFASSPAFAAAVGSAVTAGEPLRLFAYLTTDGSGGNVYVRWCSDDYATAGYRPRLTVSYTTNVAPAVTTGTAPAAVNSVAAVLSGSAANALGTAWTKVSGSGNTAFADAAQPATTVTFDASGEYVLRLSGSNAFGEVFSDLAVSVAPNPGVFSDWQAAQWPGETDANIVGPSADPERDGIANLMEWATLSDPKSASPAIGKLARKGSALEFSYSRRKAALGQATFIVEYSDSLAPGGWRSEGIDQEPNPFFDDGTLQIMKIAVPASANGRRFVRLKVTQK